MDGDFSDFEHSKGEVDSIGDEDVASGSIREGNKKALVAFGLVANINERPAIGQPDGQYRVVLNQMVSKPQLERRIVKRRKREPADPTENCGQMVLYRRGKSKREDIKVEGEDDGDDDDEDKDEAYQPVKQRKLDDGDQYVEVVQEENQDMVPVALKGVEPNPKEDVMSPDENAIKQTEVPHMDKVVEATKGMETEHVENIQVSNEDGIKQTEVPHMDKVGEATKGMETEPVENIQETDEIPKTDDFIKYLEEFNHEGEVDINDVVWDTVEEALSNDDIMSTEGNQAIDLEFLQEHEEGIGSHSLKKGD